MKKIGYVIASLALLGTYMMSTLPPALANDLDVAQAHESVEGRPEVNPKIDNPNNPAIPGSQKTNPKSVPSDGAIRALKPGDSAAEGRSRCATLTDTLARRRCLEELQRNLSND